MSSDSIKREHIGARMSRIVTHNKTVYLCGQVADDFEADITVQTQQMLAKVDGFLAEAGSSREHMLSATIYVRTMDDFAGMNDVWDAWVPEGHAPARACVEAPMARPNILVEVSIVAAVK